MPGTIDSYRPYAFPDMKGKTLGAFDFIAGAQELALTFHWLTRYQKFVARLATDDNTLWWGNLEPYNAILVRNALPDPRNTDIFFIVTGKEAGDPGQFTPNTVAEKFNIHVFTGSGL